MEMLMLDQKNIILTKKKKSMFVKYNWENTGCR